jgi:hypothetical protein
VEPSNRLMFESIEEEIFEWFRKWLCRIMEESGFQLSEPELTTTMEVHLRLVGSAMVLLEVITLTAALSSELWDIKLRSLFRTSPNLCLSKRSSISSEK